MTRYMKPIEYKFCPVCGTKLSVKTEENKKRQFCPNCGYTYYPHSAMTACAVIVKDGKALMVKRNREPYKDTWMFPAGYLDFGELPENALRREVKEETGLEVESFEFWKNILIQDDYREPNHLAFIFKVKVKDGQLDMSHDPEENSEIAWQDIKDPPEIGWESHKEIMKLLSSSS